MNTTLMNANALTPNACLTRGAIAALTEHEGETLHCTSGHLWVTVEGEPVDHILVAGESLPIPNEGKIVVSGPGCFRLSGDHSALLLAS